MIVHFSLFLLLISTSISTVIKIPGSKFSTNDHFILEPESVSNQTSPWLDHVKDFIELIDGERVLGTVLRFIDDPEVMRFIGFLLSPKFKDIIWELEIVEEFQEGYTYLKEKGFDMRAVIDAVNSDLNLPPFNPKPSLRYVKGVSGFIAAVIGILPFEDIQKLFQNKLENSPEFAELIETIKTKEFMDILKRMSSNSKISEFKTVFEYYGVDFKFICEIFEEFFGTQYNKIFCPENEKSAVNITLLR